MDTHFDFSSLAQTLKELNPKKAKFCLGIERFLKKELLLSDELKDTQIILGVSGGVDSLALFFILFFLRPRLGYNLSLAHLNHGLRKEAETESLWIKQLAEHFNIPCFIKYTDINAEAKKLKIGTEEAGRKARYAFFIEIARQYSDKTVFITTAHHLDDLSEEVLLRLIRGTGWTALAGMSALKQFNHDYYLNSFSEPSNQTNDLQQKKYLLRPLLLTPKSELIDFMQSLNCPWHEDASNLSSVYKRNRVRNLIMPLILEENPNFREKVAQLWQLARIDEEYWNTQVINKITLNDNAVTLSYEFLLKQNKALRLRLYKNALESLNAGDVLFQTLFKLDNAIITKQTGKEFEFSHSKAARLIPQGVTFYLKNTK
ncbi:tRNA lysidine(34) synthetase TilS [Desulfovibrio litoralis]|uniref:tRNA(Ile)-lysidine synthase n=1 Tax=Desulfovibrio litoralis DSM 11393 TaxID=1121455 RepID=A0A1M7SXD1_9BACT|nr:tRNA lysidine(34) synthetase TilS [Desulfovibrio litoralis]SHN63132.1 tRNA(Ile)-lysidine synthase [Desulfovibrio litoralis DSM 11393]